MLAIRGNVLTQCDQPPSKTPLRITLVTNQKRKPEIQKGTLHKVIPTRRSPDIFLESRTNKEEEDKNTG